MKVDRNEKRREHVAQKIISRAREEVLRKVEKELGKTKNMERDEEREVLVASKLYSICLEELNWMVGHQDQYSWEMRLRLSGDGLFVEGGGFPLVLI